MPRREKAPGDARDRCHNQQEWQPRGSEAGKVGADTVLRRLVTMVSKRSAIHVPQFRDWRDSGLGHFCAEQFVYRDLCFPLRG